MNDKIWMRPSDLEALTGLKESTQRKMRSEKRLPYYKIAGKVVYKREEIDRLIEEHKVA